MAECSRAKRPRRPSHSVWQQLADSRALHCGPRAAAEWIGAVRAGQLLVMSNLDGIKTRCKCFAPVAQVDRASAF